MRTLRVNRARIPFTYGEILTAFIAVAAGIGVLYVIASVSGCARVQPAPSGALSAGNLGRLYCVDKPACTVYRSTQPSPADFKTLADHYHLKSVVKLNYAIEGRDRVPDNVDLIEDPVNVLAEVSHERLLSICRDVREARKPALIHCTHGEDRTGLVVGLCVRLHLGDLHPPAILPSPETVWGEMVAYGFHDGVVNRPGLPELVETFRRETGLR